MEGKREEIKTNAGEHAKLEEGFPPISNGRGGLQ